MAIKFCPRCKSIMVLTKKDGRTVWRCPKCGYEEEANTSNAKLVERTTLARRDDKPIVLTKSGEEALPKVRKTCPRCGYEEAYFWVQQTRAADEPPTRFYKCVRCGYVWREYE
ncbi:transcription factor S [Vulcanisaeta sp. JCM 16161]